MANRKGKGRKSSYTGSSSPLIKILREEIREPDFCRYTKGTKTKTELMKVRRLIRKLWLLHPNLSFKKLLLQHALAEAAEESFWSKEPWFGKWVLNAALKLCTIGRRVSQALIKAKARGFKNSWVCTLLGSSSASSADKSDPLPEAMSSASAVPGDKEALLVL
eukprot:6485882-Amphidinium_carterae.1